LLYRDKKVDKEVNCEKDTDKDIDHNDLIAYLVLGYVKKEEKENTEDSFT